MDRVIQCRQVHTISNAEVAIVVVAHGGVVVVVTTTLLVMCNAQERREW